MRIEFYKPQPNCFCFEIYYHEEGKQEILPLEQLDSNKLSIIHHLIINNQVTLKTIKYLKSRNVTDKLEVIKRVIGKHFGKLDHVWDIDDNQLHIETI